MASFKDKMIPWYFVMFFVFIAIVDGIFVYLATSTHRGVVTDSAYQKGLDYNKTIDLYERQKQLGFSDEITYSDNKFTFVLKDKAGNAIKDAKVEVYFKRAVEGKHDFKLPLSFEGSYNAEVIFPLKGQWDATVIAKFEGTSYQQHKRIFVE